jgi:glycosyltransferase involved in cell wall biosynthesis
MVEQRLIVGINAQLRSGQSGGVEQFVIGLADALCSLPDGDERYLFLVEPGHDAWLRPYVRGNGRLLTRESHRPALMRAGLAAKRRLVAALPWLRRLRRRPAAPPAGNALPVSDGTLERAGAQIIHFPFQTAFLTELPSIYQPWDLQHLHLPEFFTPEAIARREREYRTFCERATRVIVASGWARDDLVLRYALAREKVAVIPVPAPTVAYEEPTADDLERIVRRLGLPDRYALYPAATWEHKNHLRLLEALAILRAEGVDVPLVCTGARTVRDAEIQAAARRLNVADLVTFLGFVSPFDMRVLYRRARMLVFPSLFEGWGLPIVEALADGVPVACARVTSLPDLVGDGAVLFDPYDVGDMARAVELAWRDEAVRARLIEEGRTVAAELNWDRCARAYRDQYRETLKPRSAPQRTPTSRPVGPPRP